MKDGTSPRCPACKAKFSHDRDRLCCKSCGIPDEVVAEGPRAIARWKRKPTTFLAAPGSSILVPVATTLSKSQRKAALHRHPARAKGNKHGRVGVKHATRREDTSTS